ncbi:MAG: hypothetical protein VB859_04950 [Planctomycetaceae bacterium]
MTRMFSWFLDARHNGSAAVALAMLAFLVIGISDIQAETPRSVTGKKVISFGWDMPSATEFAEHVRRLESSGLDGVVLNFTRRYDGPNPGGQDDVYDMRYRWVHWESIKLAEIQHNIDALKSVDSRQLKHNFLAMYTSSNATSVSPAQFFIWDRKKYDTSKFKPFRPNRPGEPQSWPTDPGGYFKAFKSNMVLAARLCRELGLAGFCIDQETYGRGPMNDVWPCEVFGEDLLTIRARVRKNVAAVFRAVSNEFPEIAILLIPGGRYDDDWEHKDSLAMAFTDGILMGLGPKASLHDGGEKAYDISRHKRFVALKREIRRAGLKHSAVSDLYRRRMKYSFGIWLDFRSTSYGGWYQDPFLNHFTPRDLGDALHNALYESDGYVWLYNEQAIMWPAKWRRTKKPNVIDDYFAAIRNCKQPRALDRPPDPRGADNEPTPERATSIKTAGDRLETAAPGMKLIEKLDSGWEIAFDPEDIGLWSQGIRSPGGESRFDWKKIRVGEFWENQGHRYNGAAFYRVSFKVPEKYRGKKIYIVIGGLANKCAVHLNTWDWIYGVSKGPGLRVGAAPLVFPARGVQFGSKDNLLRIYVRNPRGPGGIYKPVWVAVKDSSAR